MCFDEKNLLPVRAQIEFRRAIKYAPFFSCQIEAVDYKL